MWQSPEALAEGHWKKDCRGFDNVYKMCRRCDAQIINKEGERTQHSCKNVLVSDVEELKQRY